MMVNNKRACLAALARLADGDEEFDGKAYFSFSPIIRETKLTRQEVRRHIRALARAGLAEFARGLSDIDGGFCGSGYQITATGRALLVDVDA